MTETTDNLTAAPKPALYRGVKFEDYHCWAAISHGDLKAFEVSPRDAHWQMMHPPDSSAVKLGSAVHAMMEPGEFQRRFAREPQVDGRTKEGKAMKAAFVAENADKEILTPKLWEDAVQIETAIWDHSLASAILKSKGSSELSFTWLEDGLLCKGRIDYFCQWDNWTNIVDLKTTRWAPTPRNLERTLLAEHIHSQLAWYRRGICAHDDRPRRPVVIFAQNNPPYDVVVKMIDEAAMEQGWRDCQRWLKDYQRAQATGRWPGISNSLETISLPPWGFDRSIDWEDNDDE